MNRKLHPTARAQRLLLLSGVTATLISGAGPTWAAQPDPEAAPCPAQVLAPGQEAAIERLLAPPPLPTSVSLTQADIAIRSDEIQVTYDGLLLGKRTSFEFTVQPLQAQNPARGLRMTRRAPCPKGSADDALVPCEDGEVQGALAAVQEAFGQRMLAQGGGLKWRCAGADGPATVTQRVGAALQEIDRLLLVADRNQAIERMDKLLEELGGARLEVHEAIDLAAGLENVGRTDEARRRYEEALERWRKDGGPEQAPEQVDVAVRERVISALAATGEIAEARRLLDRCWAEVRQPRTCRSIPTARSLEKRGDPAGAAEWLEAELAREVSATQDVYLARIGLASRQGDAEVALKLAHDAAQRWPREPEVVDTLANALFRAERHREAIATYERVYRLDPAWPGTLGRLSGAFNQMAGMAGSEGHPAQEWEALKAEMKQRAAQDATDVVAVFTKGVTHYYAGELEQAIAAMEQVAPQLQREARVFIYQGMAHFWLGRQALAEQLIERARQANPNDSDVYYCYAQVIHRKDPQAAIASLERYIAMAEAPGAMRFEKKTERVKKEMALLRSGQGLPDWDRPTRAEGPGGDGGGDRLPWVLALLAAALVLGGLLLWWRR